MSTINIPASELVSVTPNVLAAGGQALDLSGLLLTNGARVPIGTVASFPDAPSVGIYFGLSSTEKAFADRYFAGFDNSNKKPAALLFAQYNQAPVAAFLRGGAMNPTVAQLQAIKPATITGSIGGVVTGAIGASFTASGSGTTLTISGITGTISIGDVVTGTGIPANTFIVAFGTGTGGNGTYTTNQATTASAASCTSTSTVLNVSGVTSGSLQVGDTLSGTGVTGGTTITGLLTGTGGTGTYRVSVAQNVPSTTVTSLSTVLKVTAQSGGLITANQLLTGTNVAANSRIVAQLSGTVGGVGTYSVSQASTTISESMTGAYDLSVTVDGTPATSASIDLSGATSPSAAATTIGSAIGKTVTYDSVLGAFVVTSGTTGLASTMGFGSGGLATALDLTQALGAVTSQGANAAVPGTFMSAVTQLTQDWASFGTTFDPDGGSGNAQKQAFAVWNGLQNNRYAYVAEDNDVTPTLSVPATTSLGYLLNQAGTSGTILIYEPSEQYVVPFVMGMIASIDFEETDGRITLAYKSQSGLTPGVTNATVAVNLGGNPQGNGDRGNGYNFYGSYSSANENFTWFQRGFVSGKFLWADSYINQIWMTNQFQLALLVFLQNSKSVPYNSAGYAAIRAACMDVITAALNFGAVRAGVPLSAAQIAEVNAAAGVKIDVMLATQGWYLQILPATAQARGNRTSPPMTFWYMDGESVQSLNLTSVTVQ